MSISPRPEIAGLEPAQHGGLDYAELEGLGLAPEKAVDFSVCTNPFGPPPSLRQALASAPIDRYPDPESTQLRRALAARLGVSPEHILVGSGSTELIRLAALAYLGPGDRVLIPTPTFGEYEVACRLAGAGVHYQPLAPEGGFRLEAKETVRLAQEHRARGLFLANPHNPSGHYLKREEVEFILDSLPDCLVIVDEAYISFVEAAWPSLDLISQGNLLVLRSLTKDYALAGLRLGYAVSSPAIIDGLRRVRPPWNVNAVAQQAGLLALAKAEFLETSCRRLREERDFLRQGLRGLGYHPLPSQAHFFLVPVGDGGHFRQALLSRGLVVRDCASFGLPQFVRLAPRTHTENQALIAAIRELIKSGQLTPP